MKKDKTVQKVNDDPKFDPRQKSLLGPDHEKELQEKIKEPETRWPEGAEL